jgi:heme A synthase
MPPETLPLDPDNFAVSSTLIHTPLPFADMHVGFAALLIVAAIVLALMALTPK